MAVLEMVKPTLEWRLNEDGPLHVWHPTSVGYDKWAPMVSEGFCPVRPGAEDPLHRLVPFIDPGTGEEWARCPYSGSLLLFRLVYPNQIEEL